MKWGRALGATVLAGLVSLTLGHCTLSDGQGHASGDLTLLGCWDGPFDLTPDFFTANPYREKSLFLRIQHGGDYEAFSDGLSILIDDNVDVRTNYLNVPLAVDLPPGVAIPGVPVVPNPNPAKVSATFYLEKTCLTQNLALYASDCIISDSLSEALSCDAGADGGPPEKGTTTAQHSTITFAHLFSGKVDESSAAERLIQGTFDFYFVDPRQVCPGGFGPLPRCTAHLSGDFNYYFQRGKPGQPFP